MKTSMHKWFAVCGSIVLTVAHLGCSSGTPDKRMNNATDNVAQLTEQNEKLRKELEAITAQEERDNRLGQYAINAMYAVGANKKLSEGIMQVLARAIVRVSNAIFETEDNKKAFIAVIAIESGFQRFAQSPTGPKGYTQVSQAAFFEALKDCGATNFTSEDVWDTELNLYAGACYFKKLLDKHGNDPYMAIVAYNQGPNSASAKTYAKNGTLHEIEPLKYIAKFTFLKRNITDKKSSDTPSVNNLPGVTK